MQGSDRSALSPRTWLRAGLRPEVWLYRGAWQEWPVTDATWLVPLSQDNVVGLPLAETLRLLQEAGVELPWT